MFGDWTTYHDNGQKASVEVYMRGKLDGPYRNWYPSGQKQSEGEFVGGKRVGPWKYWNDDGTPNERMTGEYVNDRLVKEEK
jgi:uncharacterized protein